MKEYKMRVSERGVKFMGKESKLLFIYNPHSGKGQIRHKLADILDVFAKNGMELTVHPTQCARDAYETIKKNGSKYGIVVASGGDGTLNEAFNGLMAIEEEKRPMFGYIPAGSTNDFATTLRISKNPVTAAGGIMKGKEFWCDVGKATSGYFAYVAAFGIFTEVSYATPQETKNVLGHVAYILEGIKSLTSLESYNMEITYEDAEGNEQQIKDKFLYGMVSNTSFVGGMNLIKEGELDLQDGMFEALLIRYPENPIELQQTITALLMKDFSSERFYFFRTRHIIVTGEKEVAWTLDGEYGGTVETMEVRNLAKGIKMKYKPIPKRTVFRKKEEKEA